MSERTKLAVLLAAVVLTCLMASHFYHTSGYIYPHKSRPSSISSLHQLHPSVKVVSSYPDKELSYKDCVPLPLSPKPGVKICVYPSDKDIWVSRQLKAGKLFEAEFVLQMAEVLQSDPGIQVRIRMSKCGCDIVF